MNQILPFKVVDLPELGFLHFVERYLSIIN